MTAQCADIISGLYAVALVIYDHAGAHVPVQYIQAYIQALLTLSESRGRVVTCRPGSQEVGGSIPGCATKFVRCKNLAFNFGECVSRGSDTT